MKSLVGNIAVVTGASSGIGAACARALAEEGASVVIGYNQGLDRAEAIRAVLPANAAGQTHHVMRIALSDSQAHHQIAQTPLGRVVTPEDVALSVLACVTHLKTATGTRIVIDGGQQL